MKISSVANATFGPNPQLMRWAFTGIVRPLVNYGSLVWAHELGNDSIVHSMRRLSRMAMNTSCFISRSTTTRLLEVMLGVMPLDLYCKQTATSTYLRIKQQLVFDWPGVNSNVFYSTSHMKFWEQIVDEIGFDLLEFDCCNEAIWERNFVVIQESFNNPQLPVHGQLRTCIH